MGTIILLKVKLCTCRNYLTLQTPSFVGGLPPEECGGGGGGGGGEEVPELFPLGDPFEENNPLKGH